MTLSTSRAVVIGAGPYGLATAAYLRAANVQTCVFGEAMSFWSRNMPAGMILRSPWAGSHIADPSRALTLDRYREECGIDHVSNIPLEDFIRYGCWFQRQIVPDLDCRKVTRVERASGGFRLTLEDGETLHTGRVVVAAGIARFLHRPPQFDQLPPSLASHSSEHRDPRQFSGKRVVVVGRGQSALESAVLLHEAGADVEVLVRAATIHWIGRGSRMLRRLGPLQGPARRVLYTTADVGPPGLNWIISTPGLFRRLPQELQDGIARRAIRPAGSSWLQPRTIGVQMTMQRAVISARPDGQRALLTLDDGTERCVDHVLLATGYRVDIGRYSFLAPELVAEVRRVDGYPELTAGSEASVPGLHFLGAPSARSFGPLMRFVAGTGFTAAALVQSVRDGRSVHGRSKRR
jgi:cation diffusion facilitator CzcD-associated flavoprotein CzcO